MFSGFFIDRPIFATVLSLFIVIAGLASLGTLPIAQYPDITPPVLIVQAVYPGASAEVLEQTVATPLENHINGVEDMLYMSSTSAANGVVQVQVTFNIGADINKAALNLNNRVKEAEARLPLEVRRQGVSVQKGSSSFLQVVAFYSPDSSRDGLYISNYVTLNVLDRLKRVPGTTNIQIFGAKDYAMRIWVRPDRLSQLQLSPLDLIRAINEQNSQFPVGKIGEPPIDDAQELSYTITTKGRFSTPQEFEQIIIRSNPDGSHLRLKDVARVELAGKDYGFLGRVNGHPAALAAIFLKPGSNALEVAREVGEAMDEVSARFPSGLTYTVPYDTTRFVKTSIREVLITLSEAMVLVFLVVFVFLQNWRATLIPCIAVPISLIGTLAGLLILGYSINTLTLFGMVLAIGIVVDDAIVVLENVVRIMQEEGLNARDAAIRSMREVSGPVVGIVLVLCAVFIPIAFLGGLTGELYRQFAVTISIAVVISGFVALTLTPSLCVLFLSGGHKEPGRFFSAFNRGFERITDRYEDAVSWMTRRGVVATILFLCMVVAAAGLWRLTPSSLVPDEDQGFFIAAVALPDGSSLQRTDEIVSEVVSAVKSNPANENAMAFTGFDFMSGSYHEDAATMFVTQVHWDERDVPVTDLVNEFFAKTGHITGGRVMAFAPPPIFGLGRGGGFELHLQNRGDGGPKRLAEVTEQFIAAAAQNPKLMYVTSLWRSHVPQLYVDVDREKTKALGVSLDELYGTLAATLGSYYVNDFNKFGRTWQVLLSADPEYRKSPQDVGNIYVRNNKGEMIPLKALAKVEFSSGPGTLARFNNLPSAQLFGSGAPGVSSGEAIAEVEKLAAAVLPEDFSYDWSGVSYQEKHTSGASIIALVLGALMAYLILAAQYERWSLPIAVMLALPFGTFGALAAVNLRGMSNDIYFQIGLVTLLGLAAKNAILIVAYAEMKNDKGMSASASAVEAARLRFRPILMTSLAFIFGVLPLAISSGAGAGARQSVGTGVMGGMLAATFLAIFFIPFFYKLITTRRFTESRTSAELKREAAEHRTEELV